MSPVRSCKMVAHNMPKAKLLLRLLLLALAMLTARAYATSTTTSTTASSSNSSHSTSSSGSSSAPLQQLQVLLTSLPPAQLARRVAPPVFLTALAQAIDAMQQLAACAPNMQAGCAAASGARELDLYRLAVSVTARVLQAGGPGLGPVLQDTLPSTSTAGSGGSSFVLKLPAAIPHISNDHDTVVVPFPIIPWLSQRYVINGLPTHSWLNFSYVIKVPALPLLNSSVVLSNNITQAQLVVTKGPRKAV